MRFHFRLLKLVYADKDASFIYGQPTIKDRATDVLTDTPQAKTVFATSKYFFMTFADNTATIVDIGNRFQLSTLLKKHTHTQIYFVGARFCSGLCSSFLADSQKQSKVMRRDPAGNEVLAEFLSFCGGEMFFIGVDGNVFRVGVIDNILLA